jgi:hypothetical protein
MPHVSRRLIGAVLVLLLFVLPGSAADPPKTEVKKTEESPKPAKKAPESTVKITVRDVNLYVMSSYGNSLNNRDLFKSTLPGFIGARRATAERKHLNNPSPAGLITFEGETNDNVDVLLEFTNGRFFGNWPPCPQKSKRLLWVKSKLTKEPGDVVPALPENHWMTFLRNSDRLWFESGRRSERFVLYDAELPLPAPVKVSLIEGGHGLANTGKYPLHDVTVYKPQGDKWVVGTVPLLEALPKKEEKADEKKDKKKSDPEAVFDKEKDAKDKPAEAKPGDAKPTEAKKEDAKPAEGKKDEAKPAESKPAEARKDDAKKDEVKKEDEKKPESTKEKADDTKKEAAAADKPAAATAAAAATPAAAPAASGAPLKIGPDGKPIGEEKKEPEKKPDNTKVVDVPSSKEPQDKDAIVASWAPRLKELGLGPVEVEYLSKQIAGQALRTESATIVFRLDPDQIEELFPLEVTPAPEKQIRVAIVVLLDADPDVTKRVEELVKKLGDPSYSEREKAMDALKKLGPAAKQKVTEAINDKDAEIAFRAEQLAEQLNDPAGAQPQPDAGL